MSMDMTALLNVSTSSPLSTVVKACREGEFKALIDDGEKWLQWRDGDAAKGLSPQIVILFSILDDGVRKELGREKVLVPKNIWIDTTDSGLIDMSEGKNVDLGRLLAAADKNQPGNLLEKVQSLKGAGPFIVRVAQRVDKNDPSIKYAEVRKVSKLS